MLQSSDSVASDSRQGGTSRNTGTHQSSTPNARVNEAAALPSPRAMLSRGSIGTTIASHSLPTRHPLPGSSPVIGHRRSTGTATRSGRGGSPQFPPPPSERSTPRTPDSPSRLRLQDLHRFHGLRRDYRGSALSYPLTTRRLRLTLRTAQLLPTTVAFDAGLRPDPFPDRAASLLPGFLATTRTGLSPAGDDELLLRS